MADWITGTFVTMLFTVAIALSSMQVHAAQTVYASEERQILSAAADDAVSRTIATVSAQIDSGAATTDGPYTTIGTITTPACAGTTVTGSLCTDSVVIAETATGFSGETASQAAGFAYQQQIINENRAITPSGQHLEGRAMFSVTITLQTSTGVTVASRKGTLTLRTQAAPLPNTSPPQYAVLSGFSDATGSLTGVAAESDVGGQCDPTNVAQNCAATAVDTTAVANGNGAGADDSRLHSQLVCQDPNVGNPGVTANRCTPTADPTAVPIANDNYATATVGSGNASTGWSP